MYGLVGLWVSLLEEVCHLGKALSFQKPKLGPGNLCPFLLPIDLDVELSVTPRVTFLPACYYASHNDDKQLNLCNVSQPLLTCLLYKIWLGHGVSFQQKNTD